MTWAATQARAKFSEMLDRAETEGPQVVRRRKCEFVVLVKDQEQRPGASKPSAKKHANLAEFFRNSPLVGSGIDLTRDRSDAFTEAPLVSAWDALAPSFDERFEVTFPRLKGKLRKAKLG